MRKTFTSFFLFAFACTFAQPGTWTWMKGSSSPWATAVHGTLNVPSPANDPGSRYEASEWYNTSTNTLWMYGGWEGALGFMGDLWMFDPVSLNWTWVNGSNTGDPAPVYGTRGIPSPTNTPGARIHGASTWLDGNGNLWLFAGEGYNPNGSGTVLKNDVWEYDITIKQWIWQAGDSSSACVNWPYGTYGPQYAFGPSYQPGCRYEINTSWVDNTGKFWFFGGFGAAASTSGNNNDLWCFDPGTMQWAWMGGSQIANDPGNFGTLGVPAPTNLPVSGSCYTKWINPAGTELWLFARSNGTPNAIFTFYNDVWRYDIASKMWTWMSGTNIPNQGEVYGTPCVPSKCIRPGGRGENRVCWVGNNGFYTFGGFRKTGNGVNMFNDLWNYSPTTGMWTFIKGNTTPNSTGNFGTQSVSSPANVPPAMGGGIPWKDNSGNFWMYGGNAGGNGWYNTVWKYIPDNLCAVPVITLSSAAVNACNGCNGSVTITATGGTPPYSYAWSNSMSSSAISGLCAGNYTVTVTDATGCNVNTLSVTITNQSQSATITGNGTICSGGTTTLTASGGGAYSWSTGATTAAITVSPTATSTYTVTVSNGNCSATASMQVTVSPAVNISILGNTAICNGSQTTLTASGGGAYQWSTGATTAGINVSPTASTVYTVTVTNGNCSATSSVAVNVSNPPVIGVSGNTTVCSGFATTLTATGGGNYQWNTGATTAAITITPTSGTTYTITVASGACTASASVSVTVSPSPVVALTGNNSLCQGDSTTLTASGGGTYSWSTGQTTSSITVTPSSSTSYSVTVTLGSCTSSASMNVTVNTPPAAAITGPQSVCVGAPALLTASGGSNFQWNTSATTQSISVSPSVTTTYSVVVSNGTCADTAVYTLAVNPLPVLTATGGTVCTGDTIPVSVNGAQNYLWSPSSGLLCTTCQNTFAFPSSTTAYTVIGTDMNGCSSSASVTVTVNPLPVILVAQNTSAICSGGQANLSASGAFTYVWSPSSSLNSSTAANVTASPTTATTYTVIGTDANSCKNSASVSLAVVLPPLVTVSGAGPICPGNSVVLTANGTAPLLWSTGDTSASITVSPVATTTYTVSATNLCGTASASTTVIVYPPAVVDAGQDQNIISGSSANLYASGNGSFQWSPPDNLSCTSCQAPTASPSSTTTYYVVVTDANGCTSTDSVTVFVEDLCGGDGGLFFPNAFTPDDNGTNDLFTGTGKDITSFNLKIFDRWGRLFFETDDIARGWNGTCEGRSVQEDVYVWMADYTVACSGSKMIHKIGRVTVIK